MLKAPEGASVEEIVAAFGWQPHIVRGAIAGALKKKLGLQVGSEAIDSRQPRTRLSQCDVKVPMMLKAVLRDDLTRK